MTWTYEQLAQRAEEIRRWQDAQLAEFDTEDPATLPRNVQEIWSENAEELAGHTATIRRMDEKYAELRAAANDPRILREGGADPGQPLPERSRESAMSEVPPWLRVQRDAALRTIDRYTRSGDLSARAADRLDTVARAGHKTGDPSGIGARYLAAVGNPAYNSAFGKLLADPMQGHLRFSPAEVEAVRVVTAVDAERAMSTGTGSAGGFAVPFTLDPSIIFTGNGALNPWRSISRIETTATHDWKGVSSDGVTAAYVPEGTEATDASPTLAQPTISTQQGRAFVPFSIELGQDWPGLQNELTRLISDARDVLDASKFYSGTGTNEPAGVITGLTTTQRVQTLTTATYAVGDPWLLKAGIPARFAASCTFAANPATWDTTYRFVGGNSTEPVQMPTRDGAFLGRPKVEASAMATGASTGTKLILVGDFANGFCIVDRIGMSMELIPHLFGGSQRPTGQRGAYTFWRSGSAVLAANAFRYLEIK